MDAYIARFCESQRLRKPCVHSIASPRGTVVGVPGKGQRIGSGQNASSLNLEPLAVSATYLNMQRLQQRILAHRLCLRHPAAFVSSSPSPTPRASPSPTPAPKPPTSSDIIEHWTPSVFKAVGAAAIAGSIAAGITVGPITGSVAAAVTALYWKVGIDDMRQTKHTILRNFPVLGHVRYLLEGIRPEIRQYFIESDHDGAPFDRELRSVAYQRAKTDIDTLPFGTKNDVYAPNYEVRCRKDRLQSNIVQC